MTYCDVEWLRTGFDVMEFDAQDGIVFMDELIPVATAQALNVPPLLSRMLHAQELDITGFGQSEPLTDRSVPGVSPFPSPHATRARSNHRLHAFSMQLPLHTPAHTCTSMSVHYLHPLGL